MEIRNVTPMNTAPAFGMAFKAPDEKDMARLIDYLLDSGMSAKEARKALVKMQKAHAGDSHFDFKYIHENGVDTFAVAPKTKKAMEMMEQKAVTFDTDVAVDMDGIKIYSRADACEFRCEKRLQGKKGLGKIFAQIANFFDKKALAFDRFVDPTTALPASLRQASANVRSAEARVNRRLADEAEIRRAFPPVLESVGRPMEELSELLGK